MFFLHLPLQFYCRYTSVPAKLQRNTLIHVSTSGFKTAAILDFYFRLRFWPFFHLDVILRLCSKFRPHQTSAGWCHDGNWLSWHREFVELWKAPIDWTAQFTVCAKRLQSPLWGKSYYLSHCQKIHKRIISEDIPLIKLTSAKGHAQYIQAGKLTQLNMGGIIDFVIIIKKSFIG